MISFVCPFCAKRFTVQDALAGHSLKCSQCGADVPVPAAPPPPSYAPPVFQGPPPSNVVESASRSSWFALVLGLASIVACCFSAIPSIIFGVVALSKSGVDPALLKPAKSRAVLGIVLALALSTVEFIGLALFGQKAKAEEAKDLAMADAHYAAKRWSDAKPLYEKHTKSTDDKIKAECHARIGRIHYEQGDKDAARREFAKSREAKKDFIFSCDDPKIVRFWKRAVGDLSFETAVEGSKRSDVTVSGWRQQGKSLSFEIHFKSDPKALKVELMLFGEGDKQISDKFFYWKTEDLKRNERLVTPEFPGDWDDVRKVVLYVDPR